MSRRDPWWELSDLQIRSLARSHPDLVRRALWAECRYSGQRECQAHVAYPDISYVYDRQAREAVIEILKEGPREKR